MLATACLCHAPLLPPVSFFIPQNILRIPPSPHYVLSRSNIFPRYLNRRHTAEPLDKGTGAAAGFSLWCASDTARPCLHNQAIPPEQLTTAVPVCLPTSSHTAPAPRGTPPPALSSPYLHGQIGRQPNHRAARTARTLLLLSTRPKQHADTGIITHAEQGARRSVVRSTKS